MSILSFAGMVFYLSTISKSIKCLVIGESPLTPFYEESMLDSLKKRDVENGKKCFFIRVALAAIVLASFCLCIGEDVLVLFGSKDIRFKEIECNYSYYVEATNEKGTIYKLPAKIYKINDNIYRLDEMYFSNGGYLTFEDEIRLNKPCKVVHRGEYSREEWTVKLVNEEVPTDKFEVDVGYSKTHLTICAVLLAIVFIYIVMLAISIIKNPKDLQINK